MIVWPILILCDGIILRDGSGVPCDAMGSGRARLVDGQVMLELGPGWSERSGLVLSGRQRSQILCPQCCADQERD